METIGVFKRPETKSFALRRPGCKARVFGSGGWSFQQLKNTVQILVQNCIRTYETLLKNLLKFGVVRS